MSNGNVDWSRQTTTLAVAVYDWRRTEARVAAAAATAAAENVEKAF